MNILQITHRLPYPLIDGGKIGIYNFTKHYQAAGHAVHLICIAPQEEKSVNVTPLASITKSLRIFWKDTSNKKRALLMNTLFGTLPYNMHKYIHCDVERYIIDFCKKNPVDIVHVDHLHMSYYAKKIRERFPHIKIAIREHNVESIILERFYQAQTNWLFRKIFKEQYIRLKNYEKMMLQLFDAILAITPEDAKRIHALNEKLATRTHVIPAGVELKKIQLNERKQTYGILHMAAMDWLPNQEGLRWFIKEVLPHVISELPMVQLFVVGKNTPDSFYKYSGKNIKVLGFVEEIDPILQQSNIAVVPLFTGGGMRIKILNYLADGIPVVSTTIGAEGISVRDKEHILLADSAEEFAKCVINLIKNDGLQKQLIVNGRNLVEKQYSWESIIKKTMDIFKGLSELKS